MLHSVGAAAASAVAAVTPFRDSSISFKTKQNRAKVRGAKVCSAVGVRDASAVAPRSRPSGQQHLLQDKAETGKGEGGELCSAMGVRDAPTSVTLH